MGKPWADKNPYPFQGDGDVDGDDNGVYEINPGEGEARTPNENPTSEDHLRKPGGTA